MARTLAEQLNAIDTAIEAIEAGAQSFSKDGRSYNRGDLNAMYQERRKVTDEIARESARQASHGRTVAEF